MPSSNDIANTQFGLWQKSGLYMLYSTVQVDSHAAAAFGPTVNGHVRYRLKVPTICKAYVKAMQEVIRKQMLHYMVP